MKAILRRPESGGSSASVDVLLDSDRIRIGRQTDRDIQLSDMRLSLVHAEIHEPKPGEFEIETRTRTGAWVNGVPAPSHKLNVGDVIDCGRFRITLLPPPTEVDLLLEITERVSARDEKTQRRTRFHMRLRDTALSKRRPALILAGAILLFGLALPFALRHALPDTKGASMDAFWQTGPASSAHSTFLAECTACHVQPFQKVDNATCAGCHRMQAQHSDRPELLAVSGMGDGQCSSCHLEHNGHAALLGSDPALCTDCHANPSAALAAVGLQPARRFSGEHPSFTARLPRYKAETGHVFEEVSQDKPSQLYEETNLKFSHAVHLARAGVRSPEGKTVLECKSCHVPAGHGEGFQPIAMPAHCSSCHQLDFDPEHPERTLPHGQPAAVAQIIRDHFARRALAGEVRDPDAPEITRLRRIPGQVLSAEQSRAALEWADLRAAQAIDEVFEKRICSYCHTVERTESPEVPWGIAPVALTNRYFTAARFDHAAHRTEDCALCHAANSTKTTRVLMMPDQPSCRSCHGDPDSHGQVPSRCVDCHGFHTADKNFFEAPKSDAAAP